ATSLSPAAGQAIGALLEEKVAAGMPAIAVVVVNAQQQLFVGAAGQRDAPVSRYLPEFATVRVLTTFNDADGTFESRPPARPITIRHLLTHTSGIAYSFVDARLAKIDNGK